MGREGRGEERRREGSRGNGGRVRGSGRSGDVWGEADRGAEKSEKKTSNGKRENAYPS